MPDSREEWITKRAYDLWEQAGRPDGQDHEHWAQASAEWESSQGTSGPAESSPAAWDGEELPK